MTNTEMVGGEVGGFCGTVATHDGTGNLLALSIMDSIPQCAEFLTLSEQLDTLSKHLTLQLSWGEHSDAGGHAANLKKINEL